MVAPVTDWQPRYAKYPWFVELPVTPANGLLKNSDVDAFQTKSVSVNRFGRRLGEVTEDQVDEIAAAVALCVGAP